MPGSTRFGATVPQVVGAFIDEVNQHRNLIKQAYLTITTNGSGVATVNFNSRAILSASATDLDSATSATFTIATVSTVTATTVGVVSLQGTAGGTAIAGTHAVSVVANFY